MGSEAAAVGEVNDDGGLPGREVGQHVLGTQACLWAGPGGQFNNISKGPRFV